MALSTVCVSLREYLWKGTYSNINFTQETKDDTTFKEEILKKIFSYLAKPPLCTVLRVNLLTSSIEDTKSSLEEYLKQVYHHRSAPCPRVKFHSKIPDVLLLCNHGYQGKAATCGKEIIVGSQCGNSVLRGANVFAPGVMAAHSGMKKRDKVSVYSDVDGQCRKGLKTTFTGRKIFLGNGVAEMARDEIFCSNNAPSGIAIRMTEPLYDSPPLNGFSPGDVFLQNLPSIIASHVLGPRPGETVLDMCAAPGGKTTHIGQIMKNKGVVFALDKSEPKVNKIKANAERLGLTCIKSFLWDAAKAAANEYEQQHETQGPPFLVASFDRILLDGPCSALGQRPQLVFKMAIKELTSFPQIQKTLLTVAEKLLKPGGTLVYSTCTISSEENERQVAWALQKFPSLQLAKQEPHIGGHGLEDCGLRKEQRVLVQRFDPLDMERRFCGEEDISDYDTIGFFIAKFVKKFDTESEV